MEKPAEFCCWANDRKTREREEVQLSSTEAVANVQFLESENFLFSWRLAAIRN